MSPVIENNRWSVGKDDFATRVVLPDLQGFFERIPFINSLPSAKTLIVEPGTRAMLIDDGMFIGEVPPGAYTREEFVQRLQFWRTKQATAFLVRCEDFPFDSVMNSVPCQNHVVFKLHFRWSVQIAGIVPFVENLMGARADLKISDLQKLLFPIVSQSIYTTIGNSTYDEVKSTGFLVRLNSEIKSQFNLKLKRYGIAFQDLQSLELSSSVDSIADKQGDIFKKTRELQIQQAASELNDDELRARIKDYESKTSLRDELRKIVSDDRLNKIRNVHEFESAIFEIDKKKLLQSAELESLLSAYESTKEDRDSLKKHLVDVLDLQREKEIEELRLNMDYSRQKTCLIHEIELANIQRDGESQAWIHELERERKVLDHRLVKRRIKHAANWDIIRQKRSLSREDSVAALIHEQKLEDIRMDLDVAKAERVRKLATIQSELDAKLAHENLEIQRRQQQWDLEHRKNRTESQLERLSRVQEMNAIFAERQMQMQVDMENLKAQGASNRELERIKALSQVSADVLIATVSKENAALLADPKKAELGGASRPQGDGSTAQTSRSTVDAERIRLYEKLNETERAKADAIAEAYKMAMQAQQSSVQQMISGLAKAATPNQFGAGGHKARTQVPSPPAFSGSPPPIPTADVWYYSIHGQPSGPLYWTEFQYAIQSGQVTSSTMVWKSGMPSWLTASQVPELSNYFRQQPLPLTPSSPFPPTA
jgi:hypothetical protein